MNRHDRSEHERVALGLPLLTEFGRHVNDWEGCTRCHLCSGRSRVVLARGRVPCEVLFVGEAPGESEDVLGRPFCGPAGKLLDEIIRRALPSSTTYALTNLVGCVPRDEDGGKAGEPDGDAIQACSPRLRDLVEIAKPRLIVCVGKLADTWLDTRHLHNVWKPRRERGEGVSRPINREAHSGSLIPRVTLLHPAAILRMNVAQRGLMVQRCVVELTQAVEELDGRPETNEEQDP